MDELERLRAENLTLARGMVAMVRASELAPPNTWTVQGVPWGDGRVGWQVDDEDEHGRTSLVCIFRPEDIDGTSGLAHACINAAATAHTLAVEVIGRTPKDPSP